MKLKRTVQKSLNLKWIRPIDKMENSIKNKRIKNWNQLYKTWQTQ